MKRNIIRVVFAGIFLILPLLLLASEDSVRYDREDIELRTADPEFIQKFHKDKDFNYQREEIQLNVLERIFGWLIRWLSKMSGLSGKQTGTIIEIIMYVMIGAALVYALIKILGIQIRNPLSSNEEVLDYQVAEEEIQSTNFEEEINNAVNKQEFRKAVRLTYLFALKKLSDQEMIYWKAGKTNHEYLYEIEQKELRKTFLELSTIFEYVWYGNFQIGRKAYNSAEETFSTLKTQLKR